MLQLNTVPAAGKPIQVSSIIRSVTSPANAAFQKIVLTELKTPQFFVRIVGGISRMKIVIIGIKISSSHLC